jgi:hypothetical protein
MTNIMASRREKLPRCRKGAKGHRRLYVRLRSYTQGICGGITDGVSSHKSMSCPAKGFGPAMAASNSLAMLSSAAGVSLICDFREFTLAQGGVTPEDVL